MTEPIIVVLIITNAVIVVVQGELTSAFQGMAWEDWCLLGLFVVFTLEMFARIIISGLIFDPYTTHAIAKSKSLASPSIDVVSSSFPLHRVSSISTTSDFPRNMNTIGIVPMASPLKQSPNARFKTGVNKVRAVLALTGSTSEAWKAREEEVAEKKKEEDQVREEYVESSDDDGFMFSIEPEEDFGRASQDAMMTSGLRRRSSYREVGGTSQPPSTTLPTFNIQPPPLSSSSTPPFPIDSPSPLQTPPVKPYRQRTLELPFQDALAKQRRLASLARPYLRHSWHRLDMLAIICFWVMFGLSTSKKEAQPGLHLYIFRALSILRTGRLLVVTSGTSVSQTFVDVCCGLG